MLLQRRTRILSIAILTLIILFFYYAGDGRKVQNQRFYQSTVHAIEAHRNAANEGASSVKVQPVPEPAAQAPKPDAPKVDSAKPNDYTQEMEEIPIAGRTKMTVPKNKDDESKKEQKEKPPLEADAHVEAKNELNGILKRSPIIIFSKSYCPFSARAKSILLDKYSIVPAPYVVELDHHQMGRKLQMVLGENTGRRTVPNVLVNGKSIGGGDDVSELHEKDELSSTLKSLGGKWIQEVARQEQSHHD